MYIWIKKITYRFSLKFIWLKIQKDVKFSAENTLEVYFSFSVFFYTSFEKSGFKKSGFEKFSLKNPVLKNPVLKNHVLKNPV